MPATLMHTKAGTTCRDVAVATTTAGGLATRVQAGIRLATSALAVRLATRRGGAAGLRVGARTTARGTSSILSISGSAWAGELMPVCHILPPGLRLVHRHVCRRGCRRVYLPVCLPVCQLEYRHSHQLSDRLVRRRNSRLPRQLALRSPPSPRHSASPFLRPPPMPATLMHTVAGTTCRDVAVATTTAGGLATPVQAGTHLATSALAVRLATRRGGAAGLRVGARTTARGTSSILSISGSAWAGELLRVSLILPPVLPPGLQ